MAARAETLAKVVAETGAVEIHPFDDPRVQAGQGTATLELLDAVPAIGLVVAPVSGGGLLSGTAIAAHGIDPTLAGLGGRTRGRRRRLSLAGRGSARARRRRRHDRRRPRRPAQRADARHPPGRAGRGGDRGGGRDRGEHAAPRDPRQADRGAQWRRRPGRPGAPRSRGRAAPERRRRDRERRQRRPRPLARADPRSETCSTPPRVGDRASTPGAHACRPRPGRRDGCRRVRRRDRPRRPRR